MFLFVCLFVCLFVVVSGLFFFFFFLLSIVMIRYDIPRNNSFQVHVSDSVLTAGSFHELKICLHEEDDGVLTLSLPTPVYFLLLFLR